MIDESLDGQISVSVTAGNVTLSTANNATDQSRPRLLILTGTPGTTRTVTFPDVKKLTWVFNNSDSTVTLTAGAGTTVTIIAGCKAAVYTDGATNAALLRPQYKEGTATPTITFGGASVGITYATQTFEYTVIGNRVFFHLMIVLTSKGSSTGAAGIAVTLPATPASTEAYLAFNELINVDQASGYLNVYCPVVAGGFTIRAQGDNVSSVALTDAAFSNTSGIKISGHFRI